MSKMTFCRLFAAVFMLVVAPLGVAAQEVSETSEQVMQLDINRADAPTIAAALDGVGLVKAQEIVAYREMFGSFQALDELLEVKGIGAATLERNRSRIVIVLN